MNPRHSQTQITLSEEQGTFARCLAVTHSHAQFYCTAKRFPPTLTDSAPKISAEDLAGPPGMEVRPKSCPGGGWGETRNGGQRQEILLGETAGGGICVDLMQPLFSRRHQTPWSCSCMQVIVSCPTRALRMELRSSARAAHS